MFKQTQELVSSTKCIRPEPRCFEAFCGCRNNDRRNRWSSRKYFRRDAVHNNTYITGKTTPHKARTGFVYLSRRSGIDKSDRRNDECDGFNGKEKQLWLLSTMSCFGQGVFRLWCFEHALFGPSAGLKGDTLYTNGTSTRYSGH